MTASLNIRPNAVFTCGVAKNVDVKKFLEKGIRMTLLIVSEKFVLFQFNYLATTNTKVMDALSPKKQGQRERNLILPCARSRTGEDNQETREQTPTGGIDRCGFKKSPRYCKYPSIPKKRRNHEYDGISGKGGECPQTGLYRYGKAKLVPCNIVSFVFI